MRETQFQPEGKLLVLRLYRLGRLPPARMAAEVLGEAGFPVLVVEYGNVDEPTPRLGGLVPRWRLSAPWARLVPRPLRPLAIWAVTFLRLALTFIDEGKPRFILAGGLQEQAMAWLLYRLLGIPYAVQVHEVYDGTELKGLNRFFFRMEPSALRQARFLLFPEATRVALYRRRYALSNPIFTVFNCPRRRVAARDTAASSALRAQWNIPEGDLVMAYLGGIGPGNGIDEAIAALANLPRLHFLLWGWSEPRELERLRELAARHGVAGRVRFEGELDADKWKALEACDIGYCVYAGEDLRRRLGSTASNKLMEYLAAGLAVVAPGESGFRALVEGNDVGLCVAPVTAEAVASTLERLCHDTLGLRRRRKNALRVHAEELHFERQFQPVLDHFREWLPTKNVNMIQVDRAGSRSFT